MATTRSPVRREMLPYLAPPDLGPVTSFGILAMLGIFVAEIACIRHAEKLGLDPALARRIFMWCGIGGVVGGHYFSLLAYEPGWSSQPGAAWHFINVFSSLSSWGGLLGGTAGLLWATRKTHGRRLRFADAGIVGVVVFFVFGRAGCASVHDHVGIATSFPLAIDFPPGAEAGALGGPHHDLGLYEVALFAALLATMVVLLRTPRRPGWILGVMAIGYSVPRFALDFLRLEVSDPRYAGLTPAQWCCIATVVAAIALLAWISGRNEAPPEGYAPATPWRVHLRALVPLRRA